MRHATSFRVGPVAFRVGSDWKAPIVALESLYAGYPADDFADCTVRLSAPRPWRRWLRPQVAIGGDLTLPGTVPLPLGHALLAAEMAMNLQIALGWRRHLLLHAAVVEREGEAVILTGESGAGKSTLAALLSGRGWRLLGDEFALLSPSNGTVHPHPRLARLKNESVAAGAAAMPGARWGPWLRGTPKGDIRHLVPGTAARDAMDVPVRPALILFPRFGAASASRPVLASEAFARLTTASTNYVNLGEAGFGALTRLVRDVPSIAIDYPNGEAGVAAAEDAWRLR